MTTPMSVSDLASLPDVALESVIFDQLVSKMDNWDAPRAAVERWSEPERVCFVVNATADEVFNGGFSQFFFDPAARQLSDIAAQCFSAVGAEPWAAIVQAACDLDDGDTDKTDRLSELDDQFFALDDATLSDLIVAYIRANLASFAA
ncbi:MAG: DMP19 family protein [Propionibacteriaceae bacterium]|nr:DMP19 family protein [Propionibacteriaceae bacterium]